MRKFLDKLAGLLVAVVVLAVTPVVAALVAGLVALVIFIGGVALAVLISCAIALGWEA